MARHSDMVIEPGLHPVVQGADQQRRQGGHDHLDPQPEHRRLGADPAPADAEGPELFPEQYHHRQDRSQLDDHPEHGQKLLAGIEMHQLLQQDHVSGGRGRAATR